MRRAVALCRGRHHTATARIRVRHPTSAWETSLISALSPTHLSFTFRATPSYTTQEKAKMPDSQIYPHGLTGRTIRLLTIQPGELDSALHCTLEETCLDDRLTSYHALSYCWGAARSSVQITCNSQPLLITPNLHSALLEYRRRGINLPLWADAVCINQFDVSERTLQVRMMQDIYSKAARVVVWLGEAEATDRLALEVLKAIHAPWASVLDSLGRRIPCFTGQDDASYDASLAARVPDAAFDALAAFLLRPWFSRIWM